MYLHSSAVTYDKYYTLIHSGRTPIHDLPYERLRDSEGREEDDEVENMPRSHPCPPTRWGRGWMGRAKHAQTAKSARFARPEYRDLGHMCKFRLKASG